MWDVFNTVATNNGIGISEGVILIAFLLGIVWYAKGFKIGGLINMLIFAGIFVWFYQSPDALNWSLPLILFFMHLAALALGLYGETKITPSIT